MINECIVLASIHCELFKIGILSFNNNSFKYAGSYSKRIYNDVNAHIFILRILYTEFQKSVR